MHQDSKTVVLPLNTGYQWLTSDNLSQGLGKIVNEIFWVSIGRFSGKPQKEDSYVDQTRYGI